MVKIALENVAEAVDVQWGLPASSPESVQTVFSGGEAGTEDGGGKPGLTQGHEPCQVGNIQYHLRS